MLERIIDLGAERLPYFFGVGCTDEIGKLVAAELGATGPLLLVADKRTEGHAQSVARSLAAADFEVRTLHLDADERSKSLSTVEAIVETAVRGGLTRSSVMLAMGGGLIGNVTGLAASMLFRGIRFAHLPTTPVAAFDSVLSIKQAVNLSSGKNLCGAYSTPSLIACDLAWLTTVDRQGLLNGLAEMVKNVMTVLPDADELLTRSIERLASETTTEALLDVLQIGIEAKAPFLAQDPKERKEALVFEYGHTFGHALEFGSGGTMRHGEAVAWGMLAAAEVSHALGHLDAAGLEKHYTAVRPLGVRRFGQQLGRMDAARVRRALSVDNKRGYIACGPDEVPMVLLRSIGQTLTAPTGHPLVPVSLDRIMTAVGAVDARTRAW